jgi:ligand-binding sensor domain-containing protein
MRPIRFIAYRLSFILFFCAPAFAQISYDAGDWTSYRDFRYAHAVEATTHELFVATSGGILEYQLLRSNWIDPMVVGYGLSEPITLDDPLEMLYDDQTGFLWVATRTQLLQYDINADRWRRVEKDLWAPGSRVVNIGVGGNDVFVETMPAVNYASIFMIGSPLPREDWRNYVTRYKGARNFGAFMIDTGQNQPAEIRWRGLRSRLPLSKEDLYGGLGLPPANFPSVLLTPGTLWNADGTLLDPYLRSIPITDWITDRYGNLWVTFWGAGLLKVDLRMAQTEFYAAGPAGNDVRAIQIGSDHIWMGGFNHGDRQGFSRASLNLKKWSSYEARDNREIRSTETYDVTEWNGLPWFATDEGLLSYQEKDNAWHRYGVRENLQSDHVRALAVQDSELWIGTDDGLAVMSLPTYDIIRIPNAGLEMGGVTDIALCGDTLYVGTAHGLYSGSSKTHHFRFAGLDPNILNFSVAEISVFNKEIWIATSGGVEFYNSANGQTKGFLAVEWLHGAAPSCIYAGDKFVWVGTQENGFYRYERSKNEWIQYTTADGLVDNHVNTIRPMGDDLLIGTANGLTRFYWNRPDRLR